MIFSKKPDENRRASVAYFYEQLGRHLLNVLPLSPEEWVSIKSTKGFDFESLELNSYVEIKGRNNADTPLFFEDQLEGQKEMIGWPFDHGMVLFFSYLNRDGTDDNKRLLKRSGDSLDSVSKFLACHTSSLFVLDWQLVYAIQKRKSCTPYLWDKVRERRCVNISRRELREIADYPKGLLRTLGLRKQVRNWLGMKEDQKIPSIFVKTTFRDGLSIRKFELVPLLPLKRREQLIEQLNGSVQ